jgi:hypothetical protein
LPGESWCEGGAYLSGENFPLFLTLFLAEAGYFTTEVEEGALRVVEEDAERAATIQHLSLYKQVTTPKLHCDNSLWSGG